MSIVYPITLPSTPGARSVRIRARSRVGVTPSPFTGAQQAYAWPGRWLEADVVYPPMTRAEGEALVAALVSLNGREGTFHLGDPSGAVPRGLATGTPLVNGANAVRSKTLATKGWTAGVTGILKAGDWVQAGSGTTRRLYKNLKDVNSDGSGLATLDIFPSLREALADGAALTVTSCQGTFRLAVNVTEWDIDEAVHYGLSFSCVEAF